MSNKTVVKCWALREKKASRKSIGRQLMADENTSVLLLFKTRKAAAAGAREDEEPARVLVTVEEL